MKKPKIAVIDLGTNTFHLLIAEVQPDGSYQLLFRDRLAVMIGKGGINRGMLTDEARERALRALTHFRKKINHFSASEVRASATSAFRSASNGPDLIRQIREQTGIEVQMIDGATEADLIYLGVKEAMQFEAEKVLIMDIGGGSVEFIIGDHEQVRWKKSYEIGAQRLLGMFDLLDPISRQNINELQAYFDAQLQDLIQVAERMKPATLIGASGTFDTLSDIYLARHNIQHNGPELPLSLASFEDTYQMLKEKNRQQRLQIPGMLEMRVDMIVVASCLIDFILKNLKLERIRVSAYALKEGLLRQAIDEAAQN
jgi:exopolyphosphatase/guanosine-5'-triphosphate,3'-diphosphate pyrophosphatase